MNSMHSLFSFSSSSHIHFIFYALVISLTFTSIFGGNETDHEALLKIKSMITYDPNGALTSWNNSFHFCDWTGVTCGKRHRRVTYVTLVAQGLQGSLSPHVGNLSFLRWLDLSDNNFQGAIPYELGRLSRLRHLDLVQNKFSGLIPANISGCSNLKNLFLSNNALVGTIPKEVTFLSKLTIVAIAFNNLRGGIPTFLGNLTSMKALDVTSNPLGGSIPDTLGNQKVLEIIYFGDCNLSGNIPGSLYNHSLLTNISLAENQLTGRPHSDICAMLPHLTFLQLSTNKLTGPLPPTISNCTKLSILGMSENKFMGKVRIDFSKLRDIELIELSDNNFTSNEDDEMKFIDLLKNCTKLQILALDRCKFQGILPRSIGNLSNQLDYLVLEGNQLHGNLPSSIGNLVGLEMLYLNDNKFTGNIPSSIGNLQKLKKLFIGGNQLSGQIPNSIGNLSLLITLSLYSNKLEGVIPSSLGNCHRLLELSLRDNKLNGKIPKQLLQLSSLSIVLDLSQNSLSGSLPSEVGDLKMLSKLNLSCNNLLGNIPSSLSGCGSLSDLYLNGNFFEGEIPPSLSSMKGLVKLDLSRNNFSGQIPQFLERLHYLNLSYNDFEGEVPLLGVFSNTNKVFVLGNSKLCGGIVELRLPRCTETRKHRKRFPMLAIVILIASTIVFGITSIAYACFKKKKKCQQPQFVTNEHFRKVSYNQLLKATNGFSETNLIGKGAFGSVYKGILGEEDDRYVAVKVLDIQNQGAQRSFMRECEAWRNIRHRNLVKIITSCSSTDFHGNDFKALVYEYMPKGSLHDWLHSNEGTSKLNFVQIINILIDVASALHYIHNHCIPSVVHGDLKPSNILLDDDMVAHVGDFGLAHFLGTTSYQSNPTGFEGTIGYVAPEYGLGNEMTSSGDVYSFGIIILEIMTGKMPTANIFNECLSLQKYVSMALPDHVIDIIDVNILNIYEGMSGFNNEANVKKIEECLASVVNIGVSCSAYSPQQRLDIEKVIHELKHILYTLQNIEA